MLGSASVQPTLPVVDLQRAKNFYQEKLGLKVIREDPSPGALLQSGNGTSLYIYQRAATRADHTAAAFTVKDVEAEVKELKAKGVVFEEINMPNLKTENGIATMDGMKAAWFKDTEGNILAINSM